MLVINDQHFSICYCPLFVNPAMYEATYDMPCNLAIPGYTE